MDTLRPRIVIIGNGTLASRGLKALFSKADIPLVIADCHDDFSDSWRESLAGCARRLGFKAGQTLIQPSNANSKEVLSLVQAVEPDILLSLQCRHIIRQDLLSIARIGTYNLHNAPLPLLRGCDPFPWAIHDGLKIMGVSLHQIQDEGIDNGPLVGQRLWSIQDDTTSWDLYQTALDEALMLITDTFSKALPKPVEQESQWSTYHPMNQFDFSVLEVDWSQVADTLSAWIRSRIFPPRQLPFFLTKGGSVRVEIIRCRKVHCISKKTGIVASVSPLVISAKWGGMELIQVRHNDEVLSGAVFAQRMGFMVGDSV